MTSQNLTPGQLRLNELNLRTGCRFGHFYCNLSRQYFLAVATKTITEGCTTKSCFPCMCLPTVMIMCSLKFFVGDGNRSSAVRI